MKNVETNEQLKDIPDILYSPGKSKRVAFLAMIYLFFPVFLITVGLKYSL